MEIKDIKWPKLRKVKQRNPQALTGDEINFLLRMLAGTSSTLQQAARATKQIEGMAWRESDKETEEGRDAFRALNQIRTALKKAKVQQKRLNSIISKIKTQR